MASSVMDVIARNWVLTLAYTLDWAVIIVIAGAGAALNFVRPAYRLFSVLDLNISYPIESEVSIVTVALVAGIAPAVIIFIIVALCVPGGSASRTLGRTKSIRLKAWELEKGWAGLALALAAAFFVTQGSKQLFGKPRPNMLARCQPDLSNIASHVVAGYGYEFDPAWTLVNRSICTTTDQKTLDDGFRSFPSGHSSFSWAGLLYLTLFMCSKFRISIPHLPFQTSRSASPRPIAQRSNDIELQQSVQEEGGQTRYVSNDTDRFGSSDDPFPIRNLAATPPNHLLLLAAVPLGVAVYISATRYTDYYHFGFDIIAGSVLGISTAWFSFRWYHLPMTRGHGWAWGARSRRRAFGIGVGTDEYVESARGMKMASSAPRNLEAGLSSRV